MSAAVVRPGGARLQPMHAEDVAGVMAVETKVYEFPWTGGIFNDCMRVGYNCWVWKQDDEVIGYGVMSVAAGEAHILNLCIDPGHQRRGLGRGMLEHLLGLARRYGADTVFLEVRPSNRPAVALYESLGFNQVGLRRNYYPHSAGREDALILAYRLPDGGEEE